MKKQQKMKAPEAEKKPLERKIHDDVRIDNYAWMQNRDLPEVINYLNKENSYTEEVMADSKQLREQLYNEIISRIKKDDSSVPFKKRGYYYYTRYQTEGEYPIYCRKKGSLEAVEEVILDVNLLAKDKKYCSVAGVSISPDNNMLAYGVDYVSRRLYTLCFKNLLTGENFDVEIPDSSGSLTWANDNKTVFYTLKDVETLRSYRIMRHVLGTALHEDVEIFTENDDTFSSAVFKTKSEKFLVIESSTSISTEYRFVEADQPYDPFRIFQTREKDHEHTVYHYRDQFFIITNWNAKNFRLMETTLDKTEKEHWKEVISHRADVLLEGIELFDDFMVVSERSNGLTHLNILDKKTKDNFYLDFGEEVYVSGLSSNAEFDTTIVRYAYSSLTTPPSVIDFNMVTKEKMVLKQQEVIGSFNASDYEAKRLWATARDGKKIPMSIVYKKGISLNGNNPALLYGYGSYGISIDPGFSSVRLSLLDRGFIFAIAHIRGGEEMGREWYDDGKMLNKKNTFYDFIDCAEHLIKLNYTNPSGLFAKGGSAGGLLMGTVANMRPDLFKGIIASVPFVDVVSTMLDDSIPLTTGEYDEWGNPNEKKYYDYMLSYSPYDNVEAKAYPAMLVLTGLHDSQVQYWEPSKWVAKLRELKTDSNLLLYHVNMEAGHGGASGRFEMFKETALEYAFMLKVLS